MQSLEDEATLAEGTQHVCDMNCTTWTEGEFRFNKHCYEKSPIGAIDVVVGMRVLDIEPFEGNLRPIIEAKLTVEMETGEYWSISYHDSVFGFVEDLEEYLRKYCPAPDEVVEAVELFQYRPEVEG